MANPHATIPERIADLRNDRPVSTLALQSGLILLVSLIAVWGLRKYALEAFFLPWYHRTKYHTLDDLRRRSFVNNYVHLIIRAILMPAAVYPLLAILSGHGNFDTTFHGSKVTFGDIELVSVTLAMSLYVHELLYRSNISFVSILHHIGAVAVGQCAISLTISWEHEPNASMYFCMALIWGRYAEFATMFSSFCNIYTKIRSITGLFDVLCESVVALALVIHRLYPDRPQLRFKVCAAAGFVQLANILVETPLVCWIFFHKAMWSKWQLDFKISTPIVQVVFIAAQAWTAKGLFEMALKCRRETIKKDEEEKNVVGFSTEPSTSSMESSMNYLTVKGK
jgi:hypothetical protein